MKISFVTTVYNEEKTIQQLLESLLAQTRLPDEIIITDGGSTDNTLSIISFFKFPSSIKTVKVLLKKGNRSVGRNEAIKQARGDIIVCSDAGNILDRNWIKQITAPFIDIQTSPQPSPKRRGSEKEDVDVVAGYYKGRAKTIFQKCILPYVLVMEDQVNPNRFLPATRSIAFRKAIWEKVGGFPERFSHNEDYVFAHMLKKAHAKMVFAKDAIVYWIPRSTFKQAFIMFFRFAYGDAEAKLFRPKVMLLFLRYFIALSLIIWYIKSNSSLLLTSFFSLLILYLTWSIQKNYNYVKHWKALYLLPVLQLIADAAVLSGTLLGVLKVWVIRKTR